MEKEYVISVAKEINKTLNMFAAVTMSWGIEDRRATLYKGMPALRFTTNGFVHKGDVVVALNEGEDLYECYLLKADGTVAREFRQVYVDMLIGLLDREIETGDSTKEEYKAKTRQWLEETGAAI